MKDIKDIRLLTRGKVGPQLKSALFTLVVGDGKLNKRISGETRLAIEEREFRLGDKVILGQRERGDKRVEGVIREVNEGSIKRTTYLTCRTI